MRKIEIHDTGARASLRETALRLSFYGQIGKTWEAAMTGDVEGPDLTRIAAYKHWARDTVRYGDTDRQGHVNNAVFSTFLETGRVSLLYDPEKPLMPKGTSFVMARLVLDFRAEIHWPNEVTIGTAVLRIGNSSVTFGQGIFVGNKCKASAETVLVLIDDATRKSCPLPDQIRKDLEKWLY